MHSDHDVADRFPGDVVVDSGGVVVVVVIGGWVAGLRGDEMGLGGGQVEADEDAIVFGTPTLREGGEVELFGGGEEGEGEVVGAGGLGDDALRVMMVVNGGNIFMC